MARSYPSAKHKILDATEAVILRDGPQKLSVDAVLRESGLSKGGFFHHFSSKEALLGALLERLSSSVGEQVATTMARDPERRGRSLRAQVSLAFDMAPAERARTRALVLALLAAVMENPRVAAKARTANEKTIALAKADGIDAGTTLVILLALDGYFLSESFGTLKLDAARKGALRSALVGLIEARGAGTQSTEGKRRRVRRAP